MLQTEKVAQLLKSINSEKLTTLPKTH